MWHDGHGSTQTSKKPTVTELVTLGDSHSPKGDMKACVSICFIIVWARRIPHPAWPYPRHNFQPWGREAEQQTKLPHPHSRDSESAFQSPVPGFSVTENRGQGRQVRKSPTLIEVAPPPLFLSFSSSRSFLFLSLGEVSKLPSTLQSFYHGLLSLCIMSLKLPSTSC